MTPLDRLKSEDLRVISREMFGLKVNASGKCSCPFHPPDNNESFSIFKGQDGIWRWKDHHDGCKGTVVDLMARINGISERDAIKRLLEDYRPIVAAPRPQPEVIREHVYLDAEGNPVFKKTKLRIGSKTNWRLDHFNGQEWCPGKNNRDLIPCRLEQFKGYDKVIVTEGEKDADTINGVGLTGVLATSAPTGCASWPNAITPYFSHFKTITFLYDVGNEEHVKKHASRLQAAFPACEIRIARIPGDHPREYDITNYLKNDPSKADALLEILAAARKFSETSIQSNVPDRQPRQIEELTVDNTFLNDFVSSIASVTDAPRTFILFSGIALLSGIANKFYFYFPRKIHLNLYLLLLAPSTFCRKSTCTDIVGDYLRDINPDLLLPESFTPEALFEILNKQSRGLVIWRELIQVKEFMFGSEYSKGLPAFLTDAYDYKEEFTRWTKGEGQIKVQNPVVSILAAGIASWFVKNLQEIDFQGGIWTRFLFVPAPEQEHRYRLPQKFTLDPLIKGRMINLNEKAGEEIDISGIQTLIQEWGALHMEQSLGLENGILQAVFLRLEVMLLKLAALFQLAEDGDTRVKEPAFRDAERVIEFIKRRLPSFFQEEVQFTPFDQARAKVEKYIRQRGSVSKSQLLQFTHVSTDWATRILKQLIEENRIVYEQVRPNEKGGRPSDMYRWRV